MIKSIFTFLFLFTAIITFGQEKNSTVARDIIHSEILSDDREISVYLPPSYYSTNQTYPVLYILDGDYNFFYVSGLLELQGGICENIPEMILIGISGKGTETYRNNCKPDLEKAQDKGNANLYSDFIEKELVPFVNKKYRTADFKVLAGHSIGGLFVINTVLTKPTSFNGFIAISPALWWEKNAINDIATKTFKSNPNFSSNVYVSLGNEKGMGVDEFLSVVKKSKLADSVFKYKHFPTENHNSVGSPTYVWALKDIFRTWKGEKEYFSNATELKEYHEGVMKKYGNTFNLQASLIGYTVYVLKDKEKELKIIQAEIKRLYPESAAQFDNVWAERLLKNGDEKEAETLLNESIKVYPDFFDNYNSLSKLKLKNEEILIADSLITKAIELALAQKTRQWHLNELLETKEKINALNNLKK